MKTELKKLIFLSTIDIEIDSLSDQKGLLPQLIEECEQKLAELLKSLESKKSNLISWKTGQKEKEIELAIQKESIEKREEQLKEIKTNKEYHAALKEISQTKKSAAALEEEILKLIGQTEEETPKISEMEKALSDEKGALENEISEKKREISKIEGQISEKVKQRSEHEKELNKTILNRYKTIKSRVAPAMAKAHQGTCLECYTKIPPQLYIELQKLDEVITCPRCHRILHLEIETKAE